MRDIESIHCSCGGEVIEVLTTDAEEQRFGCGRWSCCVKAYACTACHTRFTFALASPEME